MLRQRAKLISSSLFLFDLLLTVTAFFVAYWLRSKVVLTGFGPLAPLWNYLWFLVPTVLVWAVFLSYFKLYQSFRTTPCTIVIWKVLKVSFFVVLVLGTFIFLLKLDYISRSFMGVFALIAFALIAIEKLTLKAVANNVRRRGYNFRNILIIGTGKKAREFAKVVEEHKHWGLRVMGFVTVRDPATARRISGYRVVGGVKDVPEILKTSVVDEIVFAVSRQKLDQYEELFLLCEEQGVNARVPMNFLHNMTTKVYIEDLHGIPLLTFTKTPPNVSLLAAKRVFDITVALVMLTALFPLMMLVSLLIKITSPGPVMFRQERVGLNGRTFTLYKFRSMVPNAHELKNNYTDLNDMDGPVFKIKSDPRVTRVGGFIRKTSIDELPQLINVLKGEMSIVGPRPPLAEEVEQYDRWQRRRLSMKPGLTCLWQVNGRNKIGFKKWMELDLEYIDSWNLALDFKILLKTIPVVLRGTGV